MGDAERKGLSKFSPFHECEWESENFIRCTSEDTLWGAI